MRLSTSNLSKFVLVAILVVLLIIVTFTALMMRTAKHNDAVITTWKAYSSSCVGRCQHCYDKFNANDYVRFSTSDMTTQIIGNRAYPKEEAFGYKDKDGRVIVHAKFYNAADRFAFGLAAVNASGVSNMRSAGYINIAGEWVVPPSYTDTHDFVCGIGRVYIQRFGEDRKYGYVDTLGHTVHRTDLDYATDYHCEYALVGYERALSRIIFSNGLLREYVAAFGGDRAFNYHIIDRNGDRVTVAEVRRRSAE